MRNRKGSIPTKAACIAFVLLALSGCKSWIKNTTDDPYRVAGEKTQDVKKDIFDPDKGKGPKDSTGKRRAAQTKAEFRYSISGPEATKKDAEGCSCTVTIESIEIDLNMSVKFPKWGNYKDATDECKAKWDKFMKNLKTHEEGHVKINRDGKKTMLKNMKNNWLGKSKTKFAATCKKACEAAWDELDKEVKKDFDSELKKIDDEHEKYDKDTDYGKTQGAELESC